jgi:hypothetical protein
VSRTPLQVKEAHARSAVGIAGRSRDPERLRVAQRDHAAIKLEEYITRTLEAVPTLTPEQYAHLEAVLRRFQGGAK